MGRQSKRDVALAPQSTPGSSIPAGWAPAPPPQGMPGSTAPHPWWGGQPPQFRSGPSNPGCWWGAPPKPQQAVASSAPNALNSDPQNWGADSRPVNGFLSILNNPWNSPHPQHFPPHFVNVRAEGIPSMSHSLINLESGEDDRDCARIDKRLAWTKEEELRLVSAWLSNSNDHINGNCKKTDRYWGDVTNAYNSTTPKNRTRT
uniref:Myb-like domain-containing protein n=1 Tax=Arundo donax TaxID=35708 RepID=A0A0A9DHK8_ARUDO